jgi:hypothetical protein
MIFQTTPTQDKEIDIWRKTHKCNAGQTAIGGRINFAFIPTGLGILIRVECMCGKTFQPKSNYGDI